MEGALDGAALEAPVEGSVCIEGSHLEPIIDVVLLALDKCIGPFCTLLDIVAKKPLPSRRFVRKVRIRCRGRMALPAVEEVCR